MGLIPLITWAVIDPLMRAVITETQGFSAVETRASSLAFWHYIIVLLDADLLDAGFEFCSWYCIDG